MEVVTLPSYAEMSRRAAEIVCASISEKPDIVLGLPTGATPIGLYQQVVAAYERKQVDFARVRTFNLDEFVGLTQDHPASYRAYMREHLLNQVNLPLSQAHIPNCASPEPQRECLSYEAAIAGVGYLDLAMLGIGPNGHVGFNEPGAALQANVHVARLSAETRELGYAYWSASSKNPFPSIASFPKQAITMGMGTILKSARIVLLASGESKADAVRRAVTGPVTPRVPASFLQLHRHVTILLDGAAAALL